MKIIYDAPLFDRIHMALHEAAQHNRKPIAIELTHAEYLQLRSETAFFMTHCSLEKAHGRDLPSIKGVPIRISDPKEWPRYEKSY